MALTAAEVLDLVDERLRQVGALPREMKAYDKGRSQARLQRWAIAPGQIWSHHKGGLYMVVGLSLLEADGTELVTYRSNATAQVWTRTIEEFLATVETTRDGIRVRRFERVEA